MVGEIEEGLQHLAQKRQCLYESKKESLRKEIDQLRDFFTSMEKERELLECQVRATQSLCRRKLVKAEKELQHAQAQLRDTQNEAAFLLEGKHLEMERLQKERDDCRARVGHLTGESDFFRGYIKYLEEKICALVSKLHEYHNDLRKKTEEIIETRQRAVDELEWVKQSMVKFEHNLIEFNNYSSSQLPAENNKIGEDTQGIKESEDSKRIPAKSAESITELYYDNQRDLLEKLQILEDELECANKKAESASFRLAEADTTISNLQSVVSELQAEVQELKEKNLEYVAEKIEAEAGAQIREAAISVLRLRIYALEGDLQNERDNKGGKLLSSNTKTLTQLSPDINVEIKARPGLIIKRDFNTSFDYRNPKLEAAKYQLQEDAETIKKLRKINADLETDLQKARAENASVQKFSSSAWSINKMKKLEQALVEAHERYMLLRKEMNELRSKKLPNHFAETYWTNEQRSFQVSSQDVPDDNSVTSQIMQELLSEDLHYNACPNLPNPATNEDGNHSQYEPE